MKGILIRKKGNFPQLWMAIILLLQLSCKSTFDFFAIGDIPYHLPEDYSRFERVITSLNGENPAFTVHVGDIKSGSTECSDEYFLRIFDYFQKFEHPLIYTPGDNEWTDCHRDACGNYDPIERLDKIRSVFFRNNKSMGKKSISLQTQNEMEGFEKFVENAIWHHKGVTFGSLHVVGSNNNLKLDSAASNEEFRERESANLFWLEKIFEEGTKNDSDGIVLVLHAGLNYRSLEESNGHLAFVGKLRNKVMAFDKPILLVYGDFHRFMVDKPLMDENRRVLTNFTQVQVFGDRDMHAVRIRINSKNPGLFEIHPFFVEGN